MDTTILIDILKDEFRSFQEKLYTALAGGEKLVAPSVVYADLVPQFGGDTKVLGKFLQEHGIGIEPLDIDSVVAAAKGWVKYLKREAKVKCPNCAHKLNLKEDFLTDFYVAGFASAKRRAILTRDRGIYTKYFPQLVGYDNCLKESSR